MTGLEPTPVARKKALLRLLSVAEAERAAITPSREQLRDFTASFRSSFALADDASLERWLSSVKLDRAKFERLLLELCVQTLLEQRLAARIDEELASQRALWSLHAWARGEDVR